MIERQRDLSAPFEDDEFKRQAEENIELVKCLAVYLFHQAAKHLPDPPDPERPINPLGISLRPEKWEEEGLFAEDGMTLAQALEQLPGVEEFDLEKRGALAEA